MIRRNRHRLRQQDKTIKTSEHCFWSKITQLVNRSHIWATLLVLHIIHVWSHLPINHKCVSLVYWRIGRSTQDHKVCGSIGPTLCFDLESKTLSTNPIHLATGSLKLVFDWLSLTKKQNTTWDYTDNVITVITTHVLYCNEVQTNS